MDISVDEDGLWESGFAMLPGLIPADECASIRNLYENSSLFRSKIDMKRYRFGRGEYQYFAYPLPEPIADLRRRLYEVLAPIAKRWMEALNAPREFPGRHEDFLRECHDGGQLRPTPLVLRYRKGDYNCLHQDLYGDIFFPFQVVVGLSRPGIDFTGGELLLVEQQPRAQSTGRVIPLAKEGDAAVITTRYRPARGSRGYYRANIRHGVSAVTSGERFTMGLIFHDAL